MPHSGRMAGRSQEQGQRVLRAGQKRSPQGEEPGRRTSELGRLSHLGKLQGVHLGQTSGSSREENVG